MPKRLAPIDRPAAALILLCYLLAGALFAIYTPAWQAPDEPAHYNYIRQVAQAGCCPRIEEGDWDSARLSLLTSARFAAEHLERLDEIQYEDHHPPLYYLLASLVFKLRDGDLIALRLFSVALGAGVVFLGYELARRLLPGKPHAALAVMALVAFLPQHLHILASVNNDALAWLLAAGTLLALTRYLLDDMPAWQLGILVGLALLTKTTAYFLALLVPLAIWLKQRTKREALWRELAIFFVVACLIGGPWWLRNVVEYGLPDFLGLAAHDRVVADQPRSADYLAEHGLANYLARSSSTTFKSFWGQFGWMALPLDSVLGGWLYRSFALLSLAGLTGALLSLRSSWHRVSERPLMSNRARQVWLVMLAAFILVALQFVYYNLEFLQWQGRYFFPALLPIALCLAVGADYWLCRWPRARWLAPLLLTSLLVLDLYLLFRVIAPGLSPG